jgi:2-amino-4-hydroxy-6-hydroxymethyldihydropteridine diphosphokinase
MKSVYLGLGSNIGDTQRHISLGLQALQAHPQISLISVSRLYQTRPIGPAQSDYLNCAALIRTTLEPEALLDLCQEIEYQNGRERNERWGPRTLDLDLLIWPSVSIETERLTLPHPRAQERLFVLAPLLDLPEAHTIHLAGEALKTHAERCDPNDVRLTSLIWSGEALQETL